MVGCDKQAVDRRRVLQTMGAVGAVGLAGCPSRGDGDDGGNGDEPTPDADAERVPVLELSYMGNAPRTTEVEVGIDVLVNNLEELGVVTETNPMDGLTYVLADRQDERPYDITYMYGNPTPDRLDPMRQLDRCHIERAGAAPGTSTNNYTSCEVSAILDEARTAATTEELQTKISEAMHLLADDFQQCIATNVVDVGAVRTDQVEPATAGQLGFSRNNPLFYMEANPTNEENQIISDFSQEGLSSKRELIGSLGMDTLVMYNNLVNSPLLMYDSESLERVGVLAEDWETSDEGDGWSVTVTIKDGLTFHDGEEITAEDVKFTYDIVNDLDVLVQQSRVNYESAELVDERTVRFEFEEPDLSFTLASMAQWGILHQDTWEGARDDPEGFIPDDVVGSGPFELATFEPDEAARLTGRSDGNHPLATPDHDIVFVPFSDDQTKIQSFVAGEINVATSIRPALISQLESDMDDSNLTTAEQQGWMGYQIRMQLAEAPGFFKAFRKALAMVPDRRLINQLTNEGRGDVITEAAVGEMVPRHPFFPDDMPDFTDDSSGDVDGARKALAEGGFSWDDDGRLHYPSGADLEPRWPAESTPEPTEFPCLDDETGEYVG